MSSAIHSKLVSWHIYYAVKLILIQLHQLTINYSLDDYVISFLLIAHQLIESFEW